MKYKRHPINDKIDIENKKVAAGTIIQKEALTRRSSASPFEGAAGKPRLMQNVSPNRNNDLSVPIKLESKRASGANSVLISTIELKNRDILTRKRSVSPLYS